MTQTTMPLAAGPSVLLVEDDLPLAGLVAEYLGRQGMRVRVASLASEAVARLHEDPPHIVVLDVMLPDGDGFAVCRAMRKVYDGAIVMLTARDEVVDQIVGLEVGADDYLVKPVQPRLLLARMRALLRRTAPETGERAIAPAEAPASAEPMRVDAGRLSIRLDERAVTLEGRRVDLTDAEFDLLWLLARHAGRIFTRDDLMGRLRGLDYDGVDRSMDSRISRLRRKLGDSSEDPRIRTVRGKGYLFTRGDW